jgi:hypothetical protein
MVTRMPDATKQVVKCGLIMPISALDECSAEHWLEVKAIATQACDSIDEFRCEARLVSEADSVGVIHKRIIQNVYASDIVICDISGRNPNVMLELGLRLAFDRATVLIKDDKTPYSFDTGVIDHLEYPRSLRFSSIVAFKAKLADRVRSTYAASKNPSYSTFLKNFGDFHVAQLDEKSLPADGIMIEMLAQLQRDVSLMKAEGRQMLANLPHNAEPVHSNAVPEMLASIAVAEEKFGRFFWRSADGLKRLIEYLDRESECGRYWGNRRVFLSVLEDLLAEKTLLNTVSQARPNSTQKK